MTFPGPLSVSPLHAPQTPAAQELGLHAFQRVSAQILSVSGNTAILTIEGYPVVAQLASPDQAAALLARRTAQFIVTRLTDQEITLKFVNHETPTPAKAPTPNLNGPELAVRLLEQQHLPVTINNLMMARSVLKQHLPVTPGLLDEMQDALAGLTPWGAEQADLAAALKAAGLPLTRQSLALAARPASPAGAGLARLIAALGTASGQEFSPELARLLQDNLGWLRAMVLNGEQGSSQLAEQLRETVRRMGRSLENLLLEQAQQPGQELPETGLVGLLRLRQALEQAGERELAGVVDEFLGDERHHQLLNAREPGRGEWSEIGLLLQPAAAAAQKLPWAARLRIGRESGPDPVKKDAAITRLQLQVELGSGETVEVDLALAGREIRARLVAPGTAWCEQARVELGSLEAGLQRLGFALQEAQVEVGVPAPFEELLIIRNTDKPLKAVDIEV